MPRKPWILVLALLALPAFAQEAETKPNSDGVESRYAWGLVLGQVSGGRLSKQAFDGAIPRIDDTPVIGAMFTIAMTPRIRFESRIAGGTTTMLDTPNGEIDARLFMIDVGVTPHWNWGRWGFGIPAGLGWGVSQADRNLIDQIPDRAAGLALKQGSGATMFLGLRGSLRIGERWSLFGDLRARRFHRLVNVTERTVKSTEVTFGFLMGF